ncbi:MAG TPA: glycosyltransferase family 39 protein [Alphaproteobacteria bacterium]|nr:glycosyltransferase family 39 protein [Alphaproteobacteria bacterium]
MRLSPGRLRLADRPALVLGLLAVALHAWVNGRYGYFRDELYFIVCGRHADWGYVDQPPLVPWLAAAADYLAPGSLRALRAIPALMSAATIAATVFLVRRFEGRAFAQWTAGLCVLLAPVDLALGTLFTTDAFLPFAWTVCAVLIARILRTGDQRAWLWIGVVAGLALWSKYLILLNFAALAIVVPITPLRRGLATSRPYLGALIAIVIISPNLVWQWRHGWPFLELAHNGSVYKNVALGPIAYLGRQIVLLSPLAAPVWIAGLAALAISRRWRRYRVFALQYVALVAIAVLLHGKDYYVESIYPPLFAVGATALEGWLTTSALRTALAVGIVASGALAAPMAIPLLPIDIFIAYERTIGFKPAFGEKAALGVLPQTFADMFGWRDMAAKVSAAYWALPPEDRAKAAFYAANYGEAAAVDMFGDRLPPAISGHNNYFLWGPHGIDGSVLIGLARDLGQARRYCNEVDPVDRIESPYAMPYETGLFVIVCRGWKGSLINDWATLKNYY